MGLSKPFKGTGGGCNFQSILWVEEDGKPVNARLHQQDETLKVKPAVRLAVRVRDHTILTIPIP